jgi:hypothetical protein
MASSNSAVKRMALPPPPPRPRVVQGGSAKVKKKASVAKAKPVAQAGKAKAQPKRSGAAKSNRIRLLSAREANSVIDQTRIAFSVSAIGSIVGIVLGASIPLTTYVIAHCEWSEVWSIYTILVLGGLLFSAKNVFRWSKDAFRDSWKAFGFVALIEGTMIFSKIQWLGYLGLGILIAINAIASGANLVIKPAAEKPKPSWESNPGNNQNQPWRR